MITDYRCSLCPIRYKVAYKKETGECKLEISMTFADDAGEYSIFIKNSHGEASASASLLDEGMSILWLFLSSQNSQTCQRQGLFEQRLTVVLPLFLQSNTTPIWSCTMLHIKVKWRRRWLGNRLWLWVSMSWNSDKWPRPWASCQKKYVLPEPPSLCNSKMMGYFPAEC